MIDPNRTEKTLTIKFIDEPAKVVLELTNATNKTLKSIEVLTVFLKDIETPGGGPSQAHIRFDPVKSLRAGEKVFLSHKTWINGSPVDTDSDQLGRLKIVPGQINPYVLDISWEDLEGKTRYQRIPVGH